MANKRIILLSDGTGNSAGKVWRTNVWRTFESLDLTSSQQIAFYDDGVGTSSFKPFAILGGAFGFGLKRNVLDIYKFACRNYRSHLDYLALEAAAAKAENREEKYGPYRGDDIFAFGFSRGAFTIRVVNGLICEQGLVSYRTEEELDRKVAAAYRAHRAETFKSRFQVEWVFRKLRNLFVSATHDKTQRPVDHIAFLGLWDTVAAYGLPVDEMTRGVSRYLWPLELPDRQLHPLVRKACHALSLDDERTTFHPLLWDESPETVATGTRGTDSERITQVWFAGVHSNVGGGYPDDSLAHVSLTWILSEAKRRGLTLKETPDADPDAFKRVRSTQDKDGRIYDSRNGLGGYYRYGPRSVAALSDTRYSDDKRDCVKIAMPKIHESVFARIAVDAHLYAPVGLPPAYEILTYDEKIVSPDRLGYETSKAARGREKTQEHVVGSSIWRRRIIYFLTVIASVYLLAYPVTSQLPPAAEYTTRLRPLSDVIRMVGMALPEAVTSRWINAYARDPLSFVLHAGLVALLLWLSVNLRSRITDQMRCAWRVSLSKFDIHGRHAEPPAGTSALQKLLCFGLLADRALSGARLVRIPGPRGAGGPADLHRQHNQALFPVLRHHDPDHDVAQGLDHRLVQAEGRLQAGHQHHQAQDCAGNFCGPVSLRRRRAGEPLHFQRPRQFRRFLQAGSQGGQARSLHPGRSGDVHPGSRRHTSRHMHEALCRENRVRHPQCLHVDQGQGFCLPDVCVRDQQEG